MLFRVRFPLSTLLLPMLLAACGQSLSSGSTPDENFTAQGICASSTVEGIDVSEYQGTINWSAVRASGRRFAFIRVADGFYQDPIFASNWANAKAAGLYRGAYHFFRPGKDPVAQADLFTGKVGRLGDGDLPAVLDMEVTDGQSAATIVSRMRTWLSRVEAATGKRPIIYSSVGFWPSLGNPDMSSYPLWAAHWGVSCPSIPAYFSTWKFWQYSEKGRVSGISGDVDLDQWNGTLAQLAVYAGSSGGVPGGSGSLGGGVVGTPSAGANADGRLEVFVHGTDDKVWTNFQTLPTLAWSGWYSLSGSISSTPVLGWNADGRMELFARGTDGALWHSWQDTPNGSFSIWYSLGGIIEGDPAVGRNQDGRLEVFARGSGGTMYHIWQEAAGGFSSWDTLGTTPTGGLSAPAVTRGGNGRLYVFARDKGGAVQVITQVAPSSSWGNWATLSGVTEETTAAASNKDGRVEIFARGSDGALWHNWETAVGGGFSGWNSLGGTDIHEPTAALNADGRLEVFVRGGDSKLYRIPQAAPGSSWSPYAATPLTVTTRPAVGKNADGRLEVFTRASDGSLSNAWQGSPGSW